MLSLPEKESERVHNIKRQFAIQIQLWTRNMNA